MANSDGKIRVLMFPWLAHGHISPFLELAKKLTSRNFHIYFCSTPINLNSLKGKIPQKYSLSIQFVDLYLPSLPHLPPHYHTTNGLPPHLMPTLKAALDMSSPSFAKILEELSPHLLIYDFVQPWAPSLASSFNIPAVEFLCPGAAMTTVFLHLYRNLTSEFPFPQVYLCDYERAKFTHSIETSASSGIKDNIRFEECLRRSSNIVLIKTFREIEGKYIDYLLNVTNKRFVPVGPLVQDSTDAQEDGKEIIEWLNKKKASSTILVSCGTEYFMSMEEIEELAYGLELSKVNFIWVLRFPVGEEINIKKALPKGFLDRVGDKGITVKDWAPQKKILKHSNIGGFVSHCGWSSVMEGMKYGVPIIAVPMQLDQPINAKVVEEVGVGVEVKRDMNGKLQREDVGKVIRDVVMGREGEKVRKKAKEMSELMSKKGDEEIDWVVDELFQLCIKCN